MFNPKMFTLKMKKYVVVILCGLVSSIASCIYYNTLYNAKEYYDKAMKTNPPNKEFLDKSIQKCEKIVEYHWGSKYVPDALFLMGKCFLAKEEYEHATRKFQELISYFPQHKLVDACQLEIGRTYLKSGDYIGARAALEEVKQNRDEATELIIESYLLNKDYEKAIQIGNEFLAQFTKSNLRLEVLTAIGDAYDSIGVYDSALIYYEEALKLSTQRFQLFLSIGNVLIALKRYEEALQKLIPLREIAKPDERVKLELVIARCYKAKGEPEQAIETLKRLESSADAQYEMGVIYEEELKDLEKAREYYEQARKLGGTSETANQALFRASRIGKLSEYRKKIQDTTKVDELAKTQFLLAELYWVEFKHPDEALQEYEKVIQNFPQSEYAAKAAYSIAWLIEYEKKDKNKAILAYERVEKEFPNTQYAERSSQRILELKSSLQDSTNKEVQPIQPPINRDSESGGQDEGNK